MFLVKFEQVNGGWVINYCNFRLLTQAAGILKDLRQVEDAVQMMERAW